MISLGIFAFQQWQAAGGSSSNIFLRHGQQSLRQSPALSAPKLPAHGNAFLDAADQRRVRKAQLKAPLPPVQPSRRLQSSELPPASDRAGRLTHQACEPDHHEKLQLQLACSEQLHRAHHASVHVHWPFSIAKQPAPALQPEQASAAQNLPAQINAISRRILQVDADPQVSYDMLHTQVTL